MYLYSNIKGNKIFKNENKLREEGNSFHYCFTIYASLPINFIPATNTCLVEDDKQAAVSRNYENCRTATTIVRVKSESVLWHSLYYRKFLMYLAP